MKYTKEQYIEAMYGYFGPDDETSHNAIALIKTRKDHQCMGSEHHHKGEIATIPTGLFAICETAIHIDMGRVSCYVCLPCADKWVDELEGVGGEG